MSADLSRLVRGDAAPLSSPATDGRALRWLEHPAFLRARRHLESTDEHTLRQQIELTSIPAPPFHEGERGRVMQRLMEEAGLEQLSCDAVGNVVGWFPGSRPWSAGSSHPPLVVSAHLDTVFPPGMPIEVVREGNLLRGPGIADDARGLASLLALVRAAQSARIDFDAPLLVVATVGEEGTGDLRGVRHLFSERGALRSGCAAFLSLDGAGIRRIVNVGLGSLRYRATVRGPGGHSWVDYGTPNPIHALARALDNLTRVPLPAVPTTTLSIGRWGGGTSVNAIPTEAWVEFEVRSEAEVELSRMDLEIRSILDRIVVRDLHDRGAGLELTLDRLGRRPAGGTAPHHPVVEAALAATRALGVDPELALSSTDANLPMSLGVPAITLGAGGNAGQAHTPDEWYRNEKGPDGIARALLTLLLLDGR